MRQVPAGFIHSLIVEAVFKPRPDAVQIAAHAKFRNAIVKLVRSQRPLGI